MDYYHITPKSSNKKTGPIPVTTSPRQTCPPSCPLMNAGCYADLGPLGLHWNKVSNGQRGISFDSLLEFIRKLPDGQLWRHNQAGDLPGDGESIDTKKVKALVEANRGKLGFTYTHKKRANPKLLSWANANGFTINISCDSVKEANEWFSKGFPTTVVLPEGSKSTERIKICPAQEGTAESCDTCRLCARPSRKVIVGFVAHGSRRKSVGKIKE